MRFEFSHKVKEFQPLSSVKTPAGFKISKIPQRRVTCYMDEFQTQ